MIVQKNRMIQITSYHMNRPCIYLSDRAKSNIRFIVQMRLMLDEAKLKSKASARVASLQDVAIGSI